MARPSLTVLTLISLCTATSGTAQVGGVRLTPLSTDHDGSPIRACVLAAAPDGVPRYRVFEVTGDRAAGDPSLPDSVSGDGWVPFVDRTVFIGYRLRAAGDVVRQANCTVEKAHVDEVLAALRAVPMAPAPLTAPLIITRDSGGNVRYPPSEDGVLECDPERDRPRCCYFVELVPADGLYRGVWSFAVDPGAATFEPVRPRPEEAPLGTLTPLKPVGEVTPLHVLDRRADPDILIRGGRGDNR